MPDSQAAPAADPEVVSADQPVDGGARRARKRKALDDFGEWPTLNTSYDARGAVEALVAAGDGQDKQKLRAIIRESGAHPITMANYIVPKDLRHILLNMDPSLGPDHYADPVFPHEFTGYGTDTVDAEGNRTGRIINNWGELLALTAERRGIWNAKEDERAAERVAQREAAGGDLLKEFPGKALEARVERMRRVLGGEKWVVVNPENGPTKIGAGERFYDIDLLAGRASYYTLVRDEDMKKDGSGPKKGARELRMSPKVYADLVKGDAEFESLISVPEGFEEAPPRQPRAASGSRRQARQSRSTRPPGSDNRDLLATVDEAEGLTDGASAEEMVGATAGTSEVDVPDDL